MQFHFLSLAIAIISHKPIALSGKDYTVNAANSISPKKP